MFKCSITSFYFGRATQRVGSQFPQPWIKPPPPAVGAQSFNSWATSEVP